MRPSPITTRTPSIRRPPAPLHFFEFILAAFLAAALLAAFLTLTQAYVGLQRWFWLDEAITVIIARDPSPLHAFHSLTAGLDSNLPGLYILLRLLKSLGLPMTEVPLHSLTLLGLWSCLLGLYTLLRLSFDRLTAAAATFPILLAPTLIDQTFEIRFYVIWTALCIWLALTLAHLRLSKKLITPWHLAALLLTPSLILIHYFGLITLALMLICDWYADPRPAKRKLTTRWPILLGLLPVLIVPWFYIQQRRSLGSATWADPNTFKGTLTLLQESFQLNTLALLAAVLIILWLLSRYLPKKITPLHLRRAPIRHLHLLAPLAGLLAWPFILTLLSWTLQPLLLPRYTLPALAGVSLLIALLIHRFPKPLLLVFLLITIPFAKNQFNRVPPRTIKFVTNISQVGFELEYLPPNEPILFEARHDYYPVLLNFPQFQPRMYFLDFEASQESPYTLAAPLGFLLFERDAQRTFAQHYPFIQSFPKSGLNQLQSFTFIPIGNSPVAIDPRRIGARFPGWQIELFQNRLFRLTKPVPPLPPAQPR